MTGNLERLGWRFYLVTLLAIVALAYIVVPWRPVIEERLKAIMAAQGFKDADFTITDIGLQSATLENIKLGLDKPLTLSKVTLHYSLPELLKGKLNTLDLNGLSLDLRQDNGVWKIGGVEEWQANTPSDTPFLLPVSQEAFDTLPVRALQLEEGHLLVNATTWQVDTPISLSWFKEAQPTITAKSEGIRFKSGGISGTTGTASLEAKANPDKKQWEGSWDIQSIKLTGVKDDLPPLEGAGTVSAFADRIELHGRIASTDNAYRVTFDMTSNFALPSQSSLTILETTMPWMQGHVSAQKINIPIGAPKPVQIKLNLQSVSVAALLQELTGKEAVATGSVSGTLPVTFSEKGDLSVQEGTLLTNEPGTIKMPPDAIPGDNPQIALVRDVLTDFHYSLLSAKIQNTDDNKLTVTLTIEGKNPNVQGGRPVKINVNLKGDLLNFVQQNILWLYDPIKLMERSKHETN